jgi:uncharacterized protein (DUF2267 family)
VARTDIHGNGKPATGSNRKYCEEQLRSENIDLVVRLGESQATSQPSVYKTTNVGEHPLASIFFKYRSREALQQLGLLSRSPKPLPLAERDIDFLNLEALRERLAQDEADKTAAVIRVSKKQRENLRGVKREHSADSPSTPLKHIKTSEQGYIKESFSGLERHLLSIVNEAGTTPNKLRNRIHSAVLKLKALEDKVSVHATDGGEEIGDVMVMDSPAQGLALAQEAVGLGDDV